MKIWTLLSDAFAGWAKIVRGEADWQQHFRLTGPGLVTALVLFYVFAFFAIVIASLAIGVPTLAGFLDIMLVQSLWVVSLLIGIYGTRSVLRSTTPALPLLVPGIHALTAYLILGTLVSLVMGALIMVLWLGLVFMFYRLGRVAGQWSHGVAAAFAVLCVVLLVGLPMTLYMLMSAATPA